jgi:hypothetical protein
LRENHSGRGKIDEWVTGEGLEQIRSTGFGVREKVKSRTRMGEQLLVEEGNPGCSQLWWSAVGLERGQWGLFVAVGPWYEAGNDEWDLMGQDG